MTLKKLYGFCLVVLSFCLFQNLYASMGDESDLEGLPSSSRFVETRNSESHQPIHESILPFANQVKKICAEKKEEDFSLMMRGHFQQLKLMNAKGEWSPRLQEQDTNALLPNALSMKDIHTFIDDVAALASQNPIIVEVAQSLRDHDQDTLWTETIREQAKDIIPDVVAYTMVQNNMTRAQVRDIRFLEAFNEIWKDALRNVLIPKYFSPFETAKFYTIRGFYGFIKMQRAGYIDPSYGNFSLPLNIGEASISDFFMGNFKNAHSGYILMKNPPGVPENPKTGEGPSVFTPLKEFPHGGLLSFRPAFTKMWDNLYSGWNLGFVSTFKEFPYFAAKLINPQVLNYQATPEHYMYNRVLALHTHAHWLLFRRINEAQGMVSPMDWRNGHLTKIFGDITHAYATRYQACVTQARSS